MGIGKYGRTRELHAVDLTCCRLASTHRLDPSVCPRVLFKCGTQEYMIDSDMCVCAC